jgi:hypothetical protein
MKNHEHEKASDGTEAADVQSDEPSAVFYSMAHGNHSRAIVGDVLMVQIYTFSQNLTYAGTGDVNDNAPGRHEPAKALIAALGLGDVLRFSCPSYKARPSFLRSKKYRQKKIQPSRMLTFSMCNCWSLIHWSAKPLAAQ